MTISRKASASQMPYLDEIQLMKTSTYETNCGTPERTERHLLGSEYDRVIPRQRSSVPKTLPEL